MKTIREKIIGKSTVRLVERKQGYAGIVVTGGKMSSPIEGADPEEIWSQLHRVVAKSNPSFFGFNGAINRFSFFFPKGFRSAAFDDRERTYKLEAKAKLDAAAPPEQALSGKGLGEAALAAFRATNLLSPFEKTRMQEALRGPHADAFVQGAATFAMGDVKAGLKAMHKALSPHDVAKWTAVTYLPFLWRPDAHIFLKPEVTKSFASRVGHEFQDRYVPALDADVYTCLLNLAETTMCEVTELEPRDYVDIQSFVWVVGEYEDSDVEPQPAPA